MVDRKEYNKQRYINNKEKLDRQSKEWRRNNLDKWRKYSQKWRDNNPEKVKLSRQSENNKEYNKMYALKYPERIRARDYAFKHKQRGIVCSLCDSIKNLQFHHTNYERKEGFTVCVRCHNTQV